LTGVVEGQKNLPIVLRELREKKKKEKKC